MHETSERENEYICMPKKLCNSEFRCMISYFKDLVSDTDTHITRYAESLPSRKTLNPNLTRYLNLRRNLNKIRISMVACSTMAY